MATKKSTKKAATKKTSKKKINKKIKAVEVNPQITDSVTVNETENKVYVVSEQDAQPLSDTETSPVITNEDIENRANNSPNEEPATETSTYSEQPSSQNNSNAYIYILAAIGIMALAWLLVL